MIQSYVGNVASTKNQISQMGKKSEGPPPSSPPHLLFLCLHPWDDCLVFCTLFVEKQDFSMSSRQIIASYKLSQKSDHSVISAFLNPVLKKAKSC